MGASKCFALLDCLEIWRQLGLMIIRYICVVLKLDEGRIWFFLVGWCVWCATARFKRFWAISCAQLRRNSREIVMLLFLLIRSYLRHFIILLLRWAHIVLRTALYVERIWNGWFDILIHNLCHVTLPSQMLRAATFQVFLLFDIYEHSLMLAELGLFETVGSGDETATVIRNWCFEASCVHIWDRLLS